jgi:hypothetical protein
MGMHAGKERKRKRGEERQSQGGGVLYFPFSFILLRVSFINILVMKETVFLQIKKGGYYREK